MPSTSVNCSECGADLRKKNAYLFGNRRLRRVPLACGLVLSAAAGGWLGAAAWLSAAGVDYQQYKPVSWLMRETASRDAETVTAALAELTRRLQTGRLPDKQIGELIDRALAHQADRSGPWAPDWGKFVEQAFRAGKAPREKWARYLEQALAPALEARRSIGDGDDLPFAVSVRQVRTVLENVRVRFESQSLRIDGRPHPYLESDDTFTAFAKSAGTRWSPPPVRLGGKDVIPLQSGDHTLSVTFELKLRDEHAPLGRPLAVKVLTLEAPFRVLPPGCPSVKLVSEASYRAGVERSFDVSLLGFGRLGKDWLDATVESRPPPVGVSYEVFARCAGREWPVGRLARPRGGPRKWFDLKAYTPGLDLKQVELVFRPSPDAARATTDVDEAWQGEFVLHYDPRR